MAFKELYISIWQYLQFTWNNASVFSAVYELETFYGDETLQNLLTHAKQVAGEIKQYREIYTLTHDEEELGDIFYGTETEEENEEEEE